MYMYMYAYTYSYIRALVHTQTIEDQNTYTFLRSCNIYAGPQYTHTCTFTHM